MTIRRLKTITIKWATSRLQNCSTIEITCASRWSIIARKRFRSTRSSKICVQAVRQPFPCSIAHFILTFRSSHTLTTDWKGWQGSVLCSASGAWSRCCFGFATQKYSMILASQNGWASVGLTTSPSFLASSLCLCLKGSVASFSLRCTSCTSLCL